MRPMKVMLAMSGGVDSSVAGALLLGDGHDVVGVTMKLWGGDSDNGCCSVSDVDDARRVAQQLDIDHLVFNFGDDFDAHVVDPYVGDHALGITPNPCIECNRHVKFDRLLERRATRVRRRCHRTPRPNRALGPWRRPDARARRRCRQGSELCRAHARPGGAGADPVPGRRHRQDRGTAVGGRDGAADGIQARQPGCLLHHLGGWPRDVPRRSHRIQARKGGRHRRTIARRGRGGRDAHDRSTARDRPARRWSEALRGRRRRAAGGGRRGP